MSNSPEVDREETAGESRSSDSEEEKSAGPTRVARALTRAYLAVERWLETPVRVLPRSSVVVLLLALSYALLFSYVTIQKYRTFNATFLDLGLNNEVLWLTLRGAYFSSQFQTIYPFNIQSIGFVVLLPFYALYPHPEGTLVLQAFLLGFASIPLYLSCRVLFRLHLPAVVFAGCFLLYFPLQGANMFDFHFEAMFPFFFLWGFWFMLKDRETLAYPLLTVAALVNLVTLLECVLLILYRMGALYWSGEGTQRPRLRTAVRADRIAFIFGLLAFFFYVLFFQPQTVSISRVTYDFALSAIVQNLSTHTTFYIFLFAPLVFLPFLDLPLLLVGTPYVAWTATVLAAASRIPFGFQYPLMIAPILFLSAAIGLARLTGQLSQAGVLPGPEPGARPASTALQGWPGLRPRRVRGRSVGIAGLFLLLVAILSVTVAMASIYDPLGPWNSTLPQHVFDGNFGLSHDLAYTSHDALLWATVGLIPPTASVLTQSGFPQVSGRPYVAVVGYPAVPGYTYEYLLGDYSPQNFTSEFNVFNPMFPYVSSAFISRSYGDVVLSHGVVLLKRGYLGGPTIFSPPQDSYSASGLALHSGLRIEGGAEIVHTPSMGYSSVMWFGPDATEILNGSYHATFDMRYINRTSSGCSLLVLQVVDSGGQLVLGQRAIRPTDFPGSDIWTNLTVNFTLPSPTQTLEYRGVNVTPCATVELRQVVVAYVGLPPT